MIVSVLLACAIPLITGFILTGLWRLERERVMAELALRSALSVGLGFGVFSCLFFLCALPLQLSRGRLCLVELALLLCVTGTVVLLRRRCFPANNSALATKTGRASKFQRVLLGGFVVGLLSSLTTFIFLTLRLPNGRWDGWVIWNTRAKFLYKGGDHWKDAFSAVFGQLDHQPDYPLLLPLNVARSWAYVGGDTVVVPILLALLFTFAVVGMLVSSLTVLRSTSTGLIAGLVLLGTPFFILRGAALEADVPLSLYFLATAVLFFLQDGLPQRNYLLLILAGLMAGFAAWTKNEGWLFVVAVVTARSIVMIATRNAKEHLRQLPYFILGLFSVLLVVLYFKIHLAPPNTLLAGQGITPTFRRLIDVSRYLVVFRAAIKYFYSFGQWEMHPIFLLVMYPVCLGGEIKEGNRLSVFTFIITLALMMIGTFMIYVVSPYDLQWHLGTSYSRLILQLWPTVLLLYFLIIRGPEESLQHNEASDKIR